MHIHLIFLKKWRNFVPNLFELFYFAKIEFTPHDFFGEVKKSLEKNPNQKKYFALSDQTLWTCCFTEEKKSPRVFLFFFVSIEAQMAKFRICGRSFICNIKLCCTQHFHSYNSYKEKASSFIGRQRTSNIINRISSCAHLL